MPSTAVASDAPAHPAAAAEEPVTEPAHHYSR